MCNALDRCFNRYGLHYSTVRQVIVQDVTISCTWYLLVFGIVIVGVYNILRNHQYCEVVEIDERHYHSEFFWRSALWQENYDRHQNHPEDDPPYCTGEINNDFWFAPHRKYIDNECIWWYERGDITGKASGKHLRATTSYGMWKHSKVQKAQITPFIEKLNMIMHFTVNIRDIEEVPETWMKVNGSWHKLFDKDPPGQTSFIQMYIEDMLAIAGMSLDDRNEGNNGTDGMIDAPYPYNQQWPTYRLTGLQIRVLFDVSNMDHRKHLLDREVRNYITIEVDTLNSSTTWVCSGFRYLRNKTGDITQAHSCDVQVSVLVGGDMCFFSGNALFQSLTSVIVTFGVAQFLIDQLFGVITRNYYRKRFIMDDVDLQLRKTVGDDLEDVAETPLLASLVRPVREP